MITRVSMVAAGVDFHPVSHVVWCVVGFGHCLVCFSLLYLSLLYLSLLYFSLLYLFSFLIVGVG